ncbi:hypothetical protein Ciccas_000297 [Cichlidogyrus casuarinus]|uniref:NHL repeat protein n=1 Tax=Cichlidogyrus casuarinus TaxID=1844966 RepID=A0ABD2QNE9_9PLAT
MCFSCHQLGFPTSVACDSEGNLFIADNSRHSIVKFDSEGNILQSIGHKSVTFPMGVCVAPFYWVSCNSYEEFLICVDNHISLNINIFTLDGTHVASLQSVTRHNHLLAVAIDQVSKPNSLVFSSKDCRIFRYFIPQSLIIC